MAVSFTGPKHLKFCMKVYTCVYIYGQLIYYLLKYDT